MNLSLVLHAHQPPGNFDSVFQRAVDTCYGPVLDLIEERPSLRLSIHWSGPLLEWLEARAPERIAQIRRLVDARQVELVAAGMYEPVLALLPRHDRTGQLRAHRAYLARLFGVDARTGWLTERVWEPSMAADLAEGGIETVTLDDRHLLSAGLMPDDLDVPYLTESQGRSLLIAPVAEDLRMAVPWESVEDALDLLRRKAADGVRLAVYADDIEKFGMWPGTFEDIIRGGWLEAFFDGLVDLDAAGEVRLLPVGEAVEGVPDGGRVYVPDGSYPEMLEWSLPPAGQRALRSARDAAEDTGVLAQVAPFMRAGQYLQFLAKYPEVDHLHKRMLDVSARMAGRTRALRAWDPEDVPPAVRDLWSAQANCAYWHGLFGGIYLAHIRQRLWHHLLRAERALEEDGARRRPLRVFDLDADRRDEAVVTTDALVVVVDPAEGAVVELSDRRAAVNLVDTLALREEGYHDPDAPPYRYDRGRRALFVDRFLAPGRPPARNRAVEDLGGFQGQPYAMRARRSRAGIEVTLTREGDAPGGTARIEKTLRIAEDEARIDAEYRVTSAGGGEIEARFGVELNFGLLFRERPRGVLRTGDRAIALPAGGAARGVEACSIEVDGIDLVVRIEATAADLDVRAIETESRSEGGTERTPQQLAVLLTWPVRLAAGDEFAPRVSVIVEPRTSQRGGT